MFRIDNTVMSVDRLLVVASPSCAGKSTLIELIRNDSAGALCKQLRLGEIDAWQFSDAARMLTGLNKNQHVDRLVLHYDTYRPWRMNLHDYHRDDALRVLDAADEKTIITLWAPPGVLRQRMADRKNRLYAKFGQPSISPRRIADWESLNRVYSDPALLAQHYGQWLEYCSQFKPAAHWSLDTSDRYLNLEPATHLLRALAR